MAEAGAMIQLLLRLFSRRMVFDPPVALRAAVLLVAVLAYGTTGFLYFELPGNPDLTWGDGLWYTFVTLTTVGYGDFFPRTPGGRYLVAIPVMALGIGLLGYLLSIAASALVASKTREQKGMKAHSLQDHVVIFNYPGSGKVAAILAELRSDPACGPDLQAVLVDEALPELPPELARLHVRFVRGNPARDETLDRADITHARHAMILSRRPGDPASDHLNVAIALAIEHRAKHVNTVVECVDPAAQELLRKTGCDRIVCPTRFDALFVSHELLNPGAHDLLQELLSGAQGHQLYLTRVDTGAPLPFGRVAEACAAHGHTALGVQGESGSVLTPSAEHEVKTGDRVVSIGRTRLPAGVFG